MTSNINKENQLIKLSQNENAFGASPSALKAIEDNYNDAFRYPDVFYVELKAMLAERNGVSPENIVIAAGSVALMDMSIIAFVGFDENVVTPTVTFEGYKYMANVNRRECRLAPLVDNAISLKEIVKLCDDNTRLIFLANPNNPTGTIFTHGELLSFMDSISEQTYIVSDEAYIEYVTDEAYPDTLTMLPDHPNLIIFRTFSKIYGLAGLRVGYAIAHHDVINKLRGCWTPFSVNSLGYAAAIASLNDGDFIEKCAAVNAEERVKLYDALIELGFRAVEPKGNFVFVEFDTAAEKDEICQKLNDVNIIIRPLDRFGQDTAFRITVGRPDENLRVINSLKQLKL